LSHNTVAVPEDVDQAAMRDLMRNMRQNLTTRSERKSGGFMNKVKSLVGMG
jgi:hypothetical protein